MTNLESGAILDERTQLVWPVRENINLCLIAFQPLIVLSSEDESMIDESEEKERLLTDPTCPLIEWHLPITEFFHNLIVLSSPPLAIVLPSGANATA